MNSSGVERHDTKDPIFSVGSPRTHMLVPISTKCDQIRQANPRGRLTHVGSDMSCYHEVSHCTCQREEVPEHPNFLETPLYVHAVLLTATKFGRTVTHLGKRYVVLFYGRTCARFGMGPAIIAPKFLGSITYVNMV